MEEQEKLKRAQDIVRKLANGIDPIGGSGIEEDSVLNNVRISRCLFYVSDVLEQLIAKGGLSKALQKSKGKTFVYDAEKASAVRIEPRPVALSVILRNIRQAFTDCKAPTFKQMAELLKAKGILMDNPDGGTRYVAAPRAAELGVWTELGTTAAGQDYWRTLYDDAGQRLVIASLAEL